MATATKKSRAAGQPARGARAMRQSASIEFRVSQENGGAYHWTIAGGDGAILARSGSFASYDGAERAARRVRDGAAAARFDALAGETRPADLIARRHASNDESDAERWLDEGGSFSSEAVARWPAQP